MSDNELLVSIGDMLDTKLKAELDPMKKDLTDVKNKVDMVEQKVDAVQQRVDTVEQKADTLHKKVTSLELTLESETNRNIKIIAEGHLSLNRKLDEVICFTSEVKAYQEIQNIYINRHERILKEIS